MRSLFIAGVLILLLITVGSANAIQISTTNINLPEGSIKINVEYNPTATSTYGTITYTYVYNPDFQNPRITWVAYNLDVDATNIEGSNPSRPSAQPTTDWVGNKGDKIKKDGGVIRNDPDKSVVDLAGWIEKNNFGAKGEFGDFYRVYAVQNPTPENQYTQVVIKLPPGIPSTIAINDLQNQVGVHFVWDTADGKGGSCFVSGHKIDTPIPEFPTIALPVAAILGILIIFGRRKKE